MMNHLPRNVFLADFFFNIINSRSHGGQDIFIAQQHGSLHQSHSFEITEDLHSLDKRSWNNSSANVPVEWSRKKMTIGTGVYWKIWPWCWQWVFICVGLHVKYYCFCYRSMLTTLNKYISVSEASVWMFWAFDFNLILFTATFTLLTFAHVVFDHFIFVHTVLGTVSMCELCTANVQFAKEQSYIIIE